VFAKFEDVYSLCKNKVGNMFVKFVGAQYGVKKNTIWVAKHIVTSFLTQLNWGTNNPLLEQ
jgi:hypothetical protein